ncbi:MAG: 50S ribosomal protein L35 [Gaiellaceae bacterium]|jgi:large subunit ribosomal protein L35
MPKVKTHSGAKKKFKVSATGKVVRRRAMRSHILGKKTQKRKRGFRKPEVLGPSNSSVVKKMLGR